MPCVPGSATRRRTPPNLPGILAHDAARRLTGQPDADGGTDAGQDDRQGRAGDCQQ